MDQISYEDFTKVDIRVGTVKEAIVPEWSHWVIKLKVDFGEELGEKTIFTGMLGFYKPEDFVGNQFPFVINLKPKKIGPDREESQGMLMAANAKLDTPVKIADEETDHGPVLFKLIKKVPNGTKVI